MKKDYNKYIGATYKRRDNDRSETIVDYIKSYNSKNELVDVKLISEYDYLGQRIKRFDIPVSTIDRYKVANKGKKHE